MTMLFPPHVFLLNCHRPDGEIETCWASAELCVYHFGFFEESDEKGIAFSNLDPARTYRRIDAIQFRRWEVLDIKFSIDDFIAKQNYWGDRKAAEMIDAGCGSENAKGQTITRCSNVDTLPIGRVRYLFKNKHQYNACVKHVGGVFWQHRDKCNSRTTPDLPNIGPLFRENMRVFASHG
jgi:hypothetical protein